jgi:glucose-6-phosphate 1-dehydrogenase
MNSKTTEVDVMVLFGATGDLARKLLFPALYRLEERHALSIRIVGVALEDWSRDRFVGHASQAITDAISDYDESVGRRLLARLDYVGGDYSDASTFQHLAAVAKPESGCLHYLAIPPSMFETVVASLDHAGLLAGARILVEKPFGRDLASARRLNAVLHQAAPEDAIYRIDHFLGKEPVENLLAFRYANPIFDAVWNRHHIDHVQVTLAEDFDVADRGALYETLGVVRDVVQNHLLQVIGLLAMEAPVQPNAAAYAAERTKLLKATRTLTPADVRYGQYEGYRDVAHVAADSNVATYAAFRFAIDTPRWYGVPFYLRTGKAMAVTATTAVVVFKESPPLPFSPERSQPEPDRLVFRIGPSDGVDLLVQTKQPGEGVHLTTTPLTVDYETVFGRIPLAYERVIHDALEGDRSQFAHEGAVEEAWRIVDPITDPPKAPPTYARGSWGPDSAADLLDAGRRWFDPV